MFRNLSIFLLVATLSFFCATNVHADWRKSAPKVTIRSLVKTLSLKDYVSVRASTCAIKTKKRVGTSFLSLTCTKKKKPAGAIVQKSKKVYNIGNKTVFTIQSNRCDLLVTEESAARVDVSCQVAATPTPGAKDVTSTPTPKATKSTVPTNTPVPTSNVPTDTPTITPTPTATPNGQILSSGNSVVSLNTNTFDMSAPISISASDIASGEQIVAITRRPRNNMLYGLGYHAANGTVQLYIISPRLGRAQSVSGSAKAFDGSRIGVNAASIFSMDVNPNTDRIRVVVDNGDNFRMNPNTGSLVDGDDNSSNGLGKDGAIHGETASVQALAHTNTSVVASNPRAYTVDAVEDKFYIQEPAIGGDQTAGTPLQFNIESVFGFDFGFGVNAPAANTPPSGKGVIGIKVSGRYELGVLNVANGNLSTNALPTSVPTPISLAISANKSSSYPVILLSQNGASISRFSSGTIGTISNSTVTGLTGGETLVGIDFRPANGKLIGLGINPGNDSGSLYTIDPQSGAATVVGTSGSIRYVDSGGMPINFTLADSWGVDINPKTDRLRVVTSSGLNFRVVTSTGMPVDVDLTPANGTNPDDNLNGAATTSNSVAFTNNLLGTTITTQYNLDKLAQALLIQSSPDSGLLEFGVAITAPDNSPLNFSQSAGLDISNDVLVTSSNQPASTGKAVAVLTVAGTQSIYEIDLVTGHADLVGTPAVANIVDIAVGYREVN